jgi:hypothetical protein
VNTIRQAVSTADCYAVGTRSVEPLSDQPGHFLQVSEIAGLWKGGEWDGYVMTAHTVWAYEHASNGTLAAGMAVLRKPGALIVLEQGAGKSRLTLTNGVLSAWEASATATVKLASGAGAALQGRTAEWSGRLVAPGHFALEARFK